MRSQFGTRDKAQEFDIISESIPTYNEMEKFNFNICMMYIVVMLYVYESEKYVNFI